MLPVGTNASGRHERSPSDGERSPYARLPTFAKGACARKGSLCAYRERVHVGGACAGRGAWGTTGRAAICRVAASVTNLTGCFDAGCGKAASGEPPGQVPQESLPEQAGRSPLGPTKPRRTSGLCGPKGATRPTAGVGVTRGFSTEGPTEDGEDAPRPRPRKDIHGGTEDPDPTPGL